MVQLLSRRDEVSGLRARDTSSKDSHYLQTLGALEGKLYSKVLRNLAVAQHFLCVRGENAEPAARIGR